MSYATIIAHLQIGHSNEILLEAVRNLPKPAEALVIGVAVAELTQRLHEEDYGLVASHMEQGVAVRRQAQEAAEAEFRAGLQGHCNSEWQVAETFQSVAEYLAEEARGADLLIVTADQPLRPPLHNRPFDLGGLVINAGRPVLGVPKAAAQPPAFSRGMICWKDALECRRAVAEALPLLKAAKHVALVEVMNEEPASKRRDNLQAVTRWLQRHGVPVETVVQPAVGGDDAATLRVVVKEQEPDFLVAGVYSHTGLRERLFGDVTRDMLRQTDRCILLSH